MSRPWLLSAWVVVVFSLAWTHPVAFDDAFITFRYARSLADGQGLVFNVQDGPVEGFTNLAWVLLNAAALKCELDPIAFSRVLGLSSLAACLVLLAVKAGRNRLALLAALLFSWTLIRMPDFLAVTASGLETSFAALLITALGFLVSQERPSRWRFTALATALVLTRPDGALFVGAASVVLAFPLRRGWPWLLCGAAPVVAVVLFRLTYFGEFFPNTYFAKSADVSSWPAGLAYWHAFLVGAPHVALVIGAWLGLRALDRRWTRLDTFGLLGLGAYALYVARVGGDFMSYRFAFQVLPFVLFLGVHALDTRRWAIGAWAVVPISLAVLWCAPTKAIPLETTFGMQSIETMNSFVEPGRDVGLALKAALPSDIRISTTLAGTVPFYSGLFTVDEWGLNDRAIAHRPSQPIPTGGRGHLKHAGVDYLRSRGVHLALGHPAICDCRTLCDDAFPQVYVRMDAQRCVRTHYLTQTPALTRRFCTDSQFVVRHVDCGFTPPPEFQFSERADDVDDLHRDGTVTTDLPLHELLRHARGVALGTPTTRALPGQSELIDVQGPVLDSFHGGDESFGWLEYPLPEGTRRVRLRVGGGKESDQLFVGIASERQVLARVGGVNDEQLREVSLPVPNDATAPRLVVVDLASHGWGHLLVSEVRIDRAP